MPYAASPYRAGAAYRGGRHVLAIRQRPIQRVNDLAVHDLNLGDNRLADRAAVRGLAALVGMKENRVDRDLARPNRHDLHFGLKHIRLRPVQSLHGQDCTVRPGPRQRCKTMRRSEASGRRRRDGHRREQSNAKLHIDIGCGISPLCGFPLTFMTNDWKALWK